ncbi:MAG: hypothetical protein SGPRY_007476, partial [Prymnesium sp.]
ILTDGNVSDFGDVLSEQGAPEDVPESQAKPQTHQPESMAESPEADEQNAGALNLKEPKPPCSPRPQSPLARTPAAISNQAVKADRLLRSAVGEPVALCHELSSRLVLRIRGQKKRFEPLCSGSVAEAQVPAGTRARRSAS